MATADSMLGSRGVVRWASIVPAAVLLGVVGALVVAGCSRELQLREPSVLSTPYAADEVIWAVAPLVNESGVSVVDELGATDALVREITEVRGLTALPTNRTLEALRAMGLPGVRTPDEALALARALGADAVVVGSITDWYPYEPLRWGMSLVVYARAGAMDLGVVDPMALSQATTDAGIAPGRGGEVPVSGVARHFDASNHGVVSMVRAYAEGRHDPRTALGHEIYLKSMERYTQFVCHRMVELLLERERARLTVAAAEDQEQ